MTFARPVGVCPGPDGTPDIRCWACTYTGGFGTNGYSLWKRDIALESYETLVEHAERTETFTITSIWVDAGKGHRRYNLARRVVHDLWFHRMIEPVKVDPKGIVRLWRWKDWHATSDG